MSKSRVINDLSKMKITEVSLVFDPACPGADVIFTKEDKEAGHDVSNEPRDEHGRWTTRAIAAMGHAKDIARKYAEAFAGRAKAAGEATVKHTVAAVSTTRPRGAYPVRGGGVQFDFEHALADEQRTKVNTSVQIRPEHLGNDASNVAHRSLAGLHRILISSGIEVKEPFQSEPADPNWHPPQPYTAARSSFWRASFLRAGSAPASGSSGNGSVRPSTASASGQQLTPVPPTSDAVGGLRRTAPGGVPEYTPYQVAPAWVKDVWAMRPEGKDARDAEGYPIPLPGDHTHRTAAGGAYHYKGQFIPAGRPDVQKHIEEVHDRLAAEPDLRSVREAQMKAGKTPNNSAGRAYFNAEGNYIPASGSPDAERAMQVKDQVRYENKYTNEADRLEAAATRVKAASAPPPPGPLFHPPGAEHMTERQKQVAAQEAFMRDRDVLVPSDPALSTEHSQRYHIDRPTVAKRLF